MGASLGIWLVRRWVPCRQTMALARAEAVTEVLSCAFTSWESSLVTYAAFSDSFSRSCGCDIVTAIAWVRALSSVSFRRELIFGAWFATAQNVFRDWVMVYRDQFGSIMRIARKALSIVFVCSLSGLCLGLMFPKCNLAGYISTTPFRDTYCVSQGLVSI